MRTTYCKLRTVKSPTRGTSGSAGIDFFVPVDFVETVVRPGESVNIPSGISMRFPEGHALVAMNKSGIALRKDFQVGACVVDSDYLGEIHLHVWNVGRHDQIIRPGEKLVQFLMIPITICDLQEVSPETLREMSSESDRGSGGFGSTGDS